METLKLQKILIELRELMQSHYGARLRKLVLYGSQARGDATLESDIDVAVVLQGEVEPCAEIDSTGEFVAPLCLKYDAVISRLFVSEDEYLHQQSPILINVRREGLAV